MSDKEAQSQYAIERLLEAEKISMKDVITHDRSICQGCSCPGGTMIVLLEKIGDGFHAVPYIACDNCGTVRKILKS